MAFTINIHPKKTFIIAALFVIISGISATAYYQFVPQEQNSAASKLGLQNNKPGSIQFSDSSSENSKLSSSQSPSKSPQATSAPKAKKTSPSTSVQSPSDAALSPIIDTINQQLQPYGVVATLSLENDPPYGTWEKLAESDITNLRVTGTYVTDEFLKYPKDLVIKSGLKKIAFVKNLKNSPNYVSAFPSPALKAMVYDSNSLTSRIDGRRVVSHEYMHYLDYSLRGSFYYLDNVWSACNPSGFSYGNGGKTAYDEPNFYPTFHPESGFISNYAKYGIEEDRAELFSYLMEDASMVRGLGDTRIDCKKNRLTQLVRELSPAMSF